MEPIVRAHPDARLRRPRGRAPDRTVDSAMMSHPSLGLPPRDMTAGAPAAAAAVLAARDRLATRAFEAAVAADPSLKERHTEAALRRLLGDTGTLIESVSGSIASGDAGLTRGWAEMAVPVYRRHAVPMDDLATIANAIRSALESMLAPDVLPLANAALDGAIEVFHWHRRLGGDARKRNRLLHFIYKGA